MQFFEDCIMLHLLTVFPQDSAEQQRYYLMMHLKKSGKLTIFHFEAHSEEQNSYLGHLPGLVNSPKSNKATMQIEPMDEAKLAQLLLQTCPTKWQDQYSLTQGNFPHDL